MPGLLAKLATTRTADAWMPLVTAVVRRPLASETPLDGFRVSEPVPSMVNSTVTPGIGAPSVLFTWKVSVDCSGFPDPRTPIEAGWALMNWIDPAGGVAVPVAVGRGVVVAVAGTAVSVAVGAGTVWVAVGVGGPSAVTPAEAGRPMAAVTVMEKSPNVLPAVKMNEPPEVGTLVVLTHPPPANTVNGGLPPVTTKVCALPLQEFGGAPVPPASVLWVG